MAEYGLYGAMVRHSLPLPETIVKSADTTSGVDGSCAPWLLGMHRKSLEAAEHIRKHEDDEGYSLSGEIDQDDVDEGEAKSGLADSKKSSPGEKRASQHQQPQEHVLKKQKLSENPDLKSESVANLRAKAKEHSAKLMDNFGGSVGLPTKTQSAEDYDDDHDDDDATVKDDVIDVIDD